MNIQTIAASRLTGGQIARWAAILRGNRRLDTPYLRPEFTQAIAAVRNDVEVAILEEAGDPVAFFPFQRSAWNVGRPVGGCLSDFQAVIAPENFAFDPTELLVGCRLATWHFDHLLAAQSSFAPFVWREVDWFRIDLCGGFDAYAAKLGDGLRCDRKRRKLERTVGPLRFEPDVKDRSVLATLLEWKGVQYRRTGSKNLFDTPWIRNLLDKLFEFKTEEFSPMLSALYAGDQLMAVSLGLRSGSVLHVWFPAYNRDMAQFSPGILLLLEALRGASSIGLQRFDLGKGPQTFKQQYMTGAVRVAEGTVDLSQRTAFMRHAWRHIRERIRSSPFYTPARVPARMVYRVKNWFQPC